MNELAIHDSPTGLVLIGRARAFLAEARSLPEFRQVMAAAATVIEIAEQQKRLASGPEEAKAAAATAIEGYALRFDAEAAAGSWLKATADSRERDPGRGGDRRSLSQAAIVKLPDLGVTLSESSRWQKLAVIPAEVRDGYVETVRKTGGDITRSRLMRLWRELEAERRRQEPVTTEPIVEDIDIRVGNFIEALADIEPGSVDAIVTDPPYPAEYIPVFGDLGAFAAAKLTRTGVLAVMCGQAHIYQYLELLNMTLNYRWVAVYLTAGPATRMHQARVGTNWKPILLYQRRDAARMPFLMSDIFKGDGDDKRFHHWGQSEAGIASMVERLSEPGALVVDPFLGGGTTAIVCRDLKRRFIGCDIDPGAVNATNERLAA